MTNNEVLDAILRELSEGSIGVDEANERINGTFRLTRWGGVKVTTDKHGKTVVKSGDKVVGSQG